MQEKHQVQTNIKREPSLVSRVTEIILWAAIITFILALLFPSPASVVLLAIGITSTGLSAAFILAGLVAAAGFLTLFAGGLCSLLNSPHKKSVSDDKTHIEKNTGNMDPLFIGLNESNEKDEQYSTTDEPTSRPTPHINQRQVNRYSFLNSETQSTGATDELEFNNSLESYVK